LVMGDHRWLGFEIWSRGKLIYDQRRNGGVH
jgi:hypothetical protein